MRESGALSSESGVCPHGYAALHPGRMLSSLQAGLIIIIERLMYILCITSVIVSLKLPESGLDLTFPMEL